MIDGILAELRGDEIEGSLDRIDAMEQLDVAGVDGALEIGEEGLEKVIAGFIVERPEELEVEVAARSVGEGFAEVSEGFWVHWGRSIQLNRWPGSLWAMGVMEATGGWMAGTVR